MEDRKGMKGVITEGKASVRVYSGKISKDLAVFYNPVMEHNRTMSVLLLDSFALMKGIEPIVSLPLAGSGVRGIRILLETSCNPKVRMNDLNPKACQLIKTNLKQNKVKAEVFQSDASVFLLENTSSHYIDIDPFGTPNPFLDAAIRKLKSPGVLAVTATDTSALCGTYPDACRRKYWAEAMKGPEMHELGLRILARKVQLIGAHYEKALIPVMSYSKDHYMRVYFEAKRGKSKVDKMLKEHGAYKGSGPMWLGKLQDARLLAKMKRLTEDTKISEFLKVLADEDAVGAVGCHDLHVISKSIKISVPRMDKVLGLLKKNGHRAARSHTNLNAVKTDTDEKKVKKIVRSIR